MKIGIILETNNPEKAWNGVRFANTALKQGHEVKLFLMSAGVEAEGITHEKYNVQRQLHDFADARALCSPAAPTSRVVTRVPRKSVPSQPWLIASTWFYGRTRSSPSNLAAPPRAEASRQRGLDTD